MGICLTTLPTTHAFRWGPRRSLARSPHWRPHLLRTFSERYWTPLQCTIGRCAW